MYDNTNRGFLRKNDKAKTEKSPNYTGSINVEGQEYWVSGWLAEHENMGGKYFRLSLKNKDAPYKPDEQSVPEKKFDDDILF